MALFGKPKSAADILKMIEELSDEEKAIVMSTLANESDDGTEATATEEEAAEAEETAEEQPEAEETATEEPAAEDPAAEGEETMPEETPEAEETTEPEAETAPEAEAPAEALAEAEQKQDRDFGAELNALAEAIAALSNRMDALDAKKAEASEDEEYGQAFGPDITNPGKTEDDELEKARREAFGF